MTTLFSKLLEKKRTKMTCYIGKINLSLLHFGFPLMVSAQDAILFIIASDQIKKK